MEPEAAGAVVNVLGLALTQLGIPSVFVFAWYWERRAHDQTIKNYTRDLRRAAGMTIPEDVLTKD